MTIPDNIKDAYLAVAAGSKPHEREAARAIVWAAAGWLEAEHKWRKHVEIWEFDRDSKCTECDFTPADWLAEVERLLRETEGKKDGR